MSLLKLLFCFWLVSLNNVALATYTKVSNSGKALPDSAVLGSGPNDWACTYDSTTKLIWEVKTDDKGLRDQNWIYSWYDSNSPDVYKGVANGGDCKDWGRCDTEKFTQDVNTQGLCGAKDWRMPAIEELNTLVYCSSGQGNPRDLGCEGTYNRPTINNSEYFPNTKTWYFWSASLKVDYPDSAGFVSFKWGADGYISSKGITYLVRLVRGGQSFDPLVVNTNVAPTASFTATPTSGSVPLTVNLDASSSISGNGQITGYTWKTSDNQTASGKTANFTFQQASVYDITLTVTDSQGSSTSQTKQVTAAPVPKLASASFVSTNDTPVEALPILVNDTPVQQIFFKTKDDDWYEFYAQSDKRYTIEIPANSLGSSINPALQLYNAQNQPLTDLITQSLTVKGVKASGKAPYSGLFRIRVTNLTPFARSTNFNDYSYQLRVFLTDLPQQGLVRGFVTNTCSRLGISQAEVAAWLGSNLIGSTLTHKTGEYGLLLNPDDYQLKSIASKFTTQERPIRIKQDIDSVIGFEQTPEAGCQNYVPVSTDPTLLKQQAVAVYDDVTGLLIVRDVWAGEYVYYAELQNIGDYHFQLIRAIRIPGTIHSLPGDYGYTPMVANLPTVFAFNKNWKVQLKNQGNWIFTVEKAE